MSLQTKPFSSFLLEKCLKPEVFGHTNLVRSFKDSSIGVFRVADPVLKHKGTGIRRWDMTCNERHKFHMLYAGIYRKVSGLLFHIR
jgi:hypothetical protein